MADDGKLYSIYNEEMVKELRKLITKAFIIKPNYTEACFLLDMPYDPTPQSEEVIYDMCRRLHARGPEYVVLSSLPSEDSALIAVYRGSTDTITWVSNPLVQVKAHGTPEKASRIAGQFTTEAVKFTHKTIGSLRDGLALELLLDRLISIPDPQ